MDILLNSLKCVNCRKTLSSPILLPCSHMICQSHTQISDDHLLCSECGIRHPNKGFVVVQAVADMIAAQIANINFGKQHDESLDKCNELKKVLDENESLLNNLENFIDESVDELKNNILLKSEQLKQKIDQITDEIINVFEEYKSDCKNNLNNKNFKEQINDFKQQHLSSKSKCDEWLADLNQLKFDEENWKKIKVECDLIVVYPYVWV